MEGADEPPLTISVGMMEDKLDGFKYPQISEATGIAYTTIDAPYSLKRKLVCQ